MRPPSRTWISLALLALLTVAFFTATAPAHAGQSSTGELAFLPCTKCHPVTLGSDGKPVPPLPNGFEKHAIELEVHDTLGTDDKACLACHDDPSRNPGMLVLPDGTLVDITADVSRVCQRCHFEKYAEWKAGIHGKDEPKCSASGCHDPHTPSWIYIGALPPFQGTGIEVNAVGADREPFKPLAGPPVNPPVDTPVTLMILVAFGAVVSAGSLGLLLMGRSKR
ncbi:MAG: cytochrome c3 family protein [Coriobacteriia bacterium]